MCDKENSLGTLWEGQINIIVSMSKVYKKRKFYFQLNRNKGQT